MRKSALALTTVGVGAGVLYAMGRGRAKRKLSQEIEENTSRKDDQAASTETNSTGKVASMAPPNDEGTFNTDDFELDDRGTDQQEALGLIEKIKAEAFQSSDEKLALALGRPVDEIQAWSRGEQTVDSDVLMKARGLALERG